MADRRKPTKKYDGQDRWMRDISDIRRVTTAPRVGERMLIGGKVVHFDERMLIELLRRCQEGTERDGLRSRSYDGAGGGGSSEMTQTEAAALSGLPGDKEDDQRKDDWRDHNQQPDPVGEAARQCLEDHLAAIAFHCRKFEAKLAVILNARAMADKDRKSQGHCNGCGRQVPHIGLGIDVDRLVSGYCDRVAGPAWSGCYRKWLDQGRPDRAAFERWVLGELAIQAAEAELPDGPGYQVDEIDSLVANGTLPSKDGGRAA